MPSYYDIPAYYGIGRTLEHINELDDCYRRNRNSRHWAYRRFNNPGRRERVEEEIARQLNGLLGDFEGVNDARNPAGF